MRADQKPERHLIDIFSRKTQVQAGNAESRTRWMAGRKHGRVARIPAILAGMTARLKEEWSPLPWAYGMVE
jgi:hypothetical protein